MDDLVTWLRTQLDDDQQVANGLGEITEVDRGGLGSVAGWNLIDYVVVSVSP
jgi:hypothetical protein